MLTTIKSRRILHFISVTLALFVFGYGLFLKLTKEEVVPANKETKLELVKNDSGLKNESKDLLEVTLPN